MNRRKAAEAYANYVTERLPIGLMEAYSKLSELLPSELIAETGGYAHQVFTHEMHDLIVGFLVEEWDNWYPYIDAEARLQVDRRMRWT